MQDPQGGYLACGHKRDACVSWGLQQIAQVLGVTAEAIKNFSEEAVINIISSTLHDNAGSVNNNCTLNFNPMDKLLEVIEENKSSMNGCCRLKKRKTNC
jgi:predicted Ser/Thr protein kinase